MKACIECLPCLMKNVVSLARKSAGGDEQLEAKIALGGMGVLGRAVESGLTRAPAYYARQLIDDALACCNGAVTDPLEPEKTMSTEFALKLVGRLHEIPGWKDDSFESCLRLSIAGNILDFSIYHDLSVEQAMEDIAAVFAKPLDSSAIDELRKRMDRAKKILWIFDNCGEAVFDRLLIERYCEKTTLAVRGKPAFNDITRAELAESGYAGKLAACPVVANDDGMMGVIDETCGEEYRRAIAESDLIIAKGQANFETMNERPDVGKIVFLFLAKCPVVCGVIGAEMKSVQILFRD